MEKTDDYIKSRLLWRAKQHRLPTSSSFHFSDLDGNIKEYLVANINDASGIPVLFFTKPSKEWTLLCTRQVICNNNQTVFRLALADIATFKPTVLENMKGRIDLKMHSKFEWHEVTVFDKRGNRYVLHAEKGEDLLHCGISC
ncbi:hypothetical protein [Paraflavitalea speifideaquila]|uniref:hypothetical protein n=1 Tax=Paraflavitalea speifideaquila TaxID=3076558 RepID=UPI0028EC08B3|nr:hypothetical protein [Paraflavitalea speifideiaquila]